MSAFSKVREIIFNNIEADVISQLSADELRFDLLKAIDAISKQEAIPISQADRITYVSELINELIALGPIQKLIDDPSVSDIMVNGPKNVYIERNGLLSKTDIVFIDEMQLQTIAKRIASQVSRRLDESSPICDARLPDGSRVNMVLPPISLDGTSLSIRKFKNHNIGLMDLVRGGSMTERMAKILMVAAHCRLNIIVSGGTGSGKTTLLNALSEYISDEERIVTIEDAAELRLKNQHVLRMETRKNNAEGSGMIDQNQLVINALRMRPDRIIIGECRGAETFEMLQAMNTGHDGSMTTLHANSPREAVSRIENMVMMGSVNLPTLGIKKNIVGAIDLIIQIKRLNDGSRRVTSISEVIGMEGEVIVMDEYFSIDIQNLPKNKNEQASYVENSISARSAIKVKADMFGVNISSII